jgi:hypothetical protein
VKVQIVKINPDTQRISLGMKQLQSDPWDGVEAKYPVGAKFTGRITNITDYGAFVELDPGIEGLIHVSDADVRRLMGRRLPDAVLHGKWSLRPRSRAVRRLAAAGVLECGLLARLDWRLRRRPADWVQTRL